MKTILLLHGALGSSKQFENLSQILEDDNSVFSFDFQGHGSASYVLESFSIEKLTEQLHDFIIKNKLLDLTIFGYSMGGYVALNHELVYPGYVRKIVTLATKFDWNENNVLKETLQLDVLQMKQNVPEFTGVLKVRHGDQWEQLVSNTIDMMKKLAAQPLLNEHTLKSVKIPVRVCIGDRDKMVSIEESENTVKMLPDAKVEILQNTPHPLERISDQVLAELISR
jgi:pimeloyl-ACP methyl ester carboxylesterase